MRKFWDREGINDKSICFWICTYIEDGVSNLNPSTWEVLDSSQRDCDGLGKGNQNVVLTHYCSIMNIN